MFGWSRKEKLTKFVAEDVSAWRLICTSIVTSRDYLDKFYPSDRCLATENHRDWVLVGFMACFLHVCMLRNTMDCFAELSRQVDELDIGFQEKFRTAMSILKRTTFISTQEQISVAKEALHTSDGGLAIMLLFCREFLCGLTTQSDIKLLNLGALSLFDNYFRGIASSKAIQFEQGN